jgi:HD-GYP domain-containing protein (c-di-GMP phosphodiesterase class II)
VLSQLALGERIRRLEAETVTAEVVSSASQTLLNATLDLDDLGRLLLDLAMRITESDAGLILLAREVTEARRTSVLATAGFAESHVQALLDEFDRHGRLPFEERVTVDTVALDSEAHALLRRLGFPALLHLPIGPAPSGAFLLARRVGAFWERHVPICRLEVDRLTLSLKNRAFHEAIFNEYKAMLETMVTTHESTSPHLRGHSDRVAGLAGDLAEAMGRTPAEVEGIRLAGRLHDIGMIGLGGEIVLKPGRLTPKEYDLVKHHPTIGAALITPIHLPIPIAPLVLHHHERHDGLGYPDGLKGLEIPFGARLLALAEVFDAMITPRSYRDALSFEDGRQRIRLMAGTQLDPATVDVFLQVITSERWHAIASHT